ncbi:bestrophin-2 [Trichonephila clavipes]|nr:bestrophin-2 [Trichonephila clavipes]
MRYLNLSLVLVLRSISMAVKRRFPTKEHLIEAGFMTKTELEMFQSVPSTEFNTFWIPCTWFINVLREARQECRITDSNGLKLIMEELNEFRSKCGLLWGYDWISIPLVYTQVVTMATYAFFVACMFGRQNVNIISDKPSSPEVHRYDYYVPIFTILQLMFYMGLLKVAEQLINPFGDDDEDFELNWIIDRHMKVSYLGVDTLNGTPPPLVKDTYYDELDVKIPYTEASKSYKKKTYRGSVAYMQRKEADGSEQASLLSNSLQERDDKCRGLLWPDAFTKGAYSPAVLNAASR